MKFYKIALSSAVVCYALGNTQNPNERVDVRGDLVVEGDTVANEFTCPSMMGSDSCNSKQDVATTKLKATEGITDELHVDTLTPSQGTLDIDSDLIITEPIETAKLEPSSLGTYGEQDWNVFAIDNFNTPDQKEGWSFTETSSCHDSRIYNDIFLGGHCKLSEKEVTKTFYNIPKHSHLAVMAKFHMFDNWQGEYGYMKINDQLVWKETGTCKDKTGSMNLCGGKDSDPSYNIPIDYAFAHNDDSVKVTFGSTLKRDPCEASYAIDDVMLFVA